MPDPEFPDCIRYNPDNNSTLFAVTDEGGEVVAVHEVFLDENALEIGRVTHGLPDEGFVRFQGIDPPVVYRGEPEDGLKLRIDTGQTVWVDVAEIEDRPPTWH